MPLPTSAWAQARERFLEDLEEPERLMFATALVLAVENTDNPQFKLLLEFGAVFGAERKPSSTKAAAHRNIELVNSLLRMGKIQTC